MRIVWHEKARQQLADELDYCLEQFGRKAVIRLLDSLDRDESLLSANPYLGRIEPLLEMKESSFRSLVERHFKLIYTVEADYIFIHILWNCRQEPNDLAEQL